MAIDTAPDDTGTPSVPVTPALPYGSPYGVPPGPADMATGPMGGPGGSPAAPMGGPPSGPQTGAMVYKGHIVKPLAQPQKGPAVDIPSLPDYILRQVMSNENEHNTVANLKDSDIMSYTDAYAHLHHGVGEHNTSGEKMSSGDRNALIESVADKFKSTVFQHLPALKAALAAEEAKYKGANVTTPPDTGYTATSNPATDVLTGAIGGIPKMAGALGGLASEYITDPLRRAGVAMGISAMTPEQVAEKHKQDIEGASKLYDIGQEFENKNLTPHALAKLKEVEADNAKFASDPNNNILDKIVHNVSNVIKNPSLLPSTFGELITPLGGAGAIEKGLAKAVLPNVLKKSAQNIPFVTQQLGNLPVTVFNQAKQEGLTDEQAVEAAKHAAFSPEAAVAALAMAAPIGSARVTGAGLKGVTGVATRTVGQGVQMGAASAADKRAQNIALGKPPNEGVDEAFAQGAAGAIPLAAGFEGVHAVLGGKGAVKAPAKPTGEAAGAAPGVEPAPGAPEGPQPPAGGAQRPTAGLSPAAKTAFTEALNEAKVPADVSPEIKEAQLKEALDDLEARLTAHEVPEAQIDAAKVDFEAQVRRQNGIEKPTVTETGEPTPGEAQAATKEEPNEELIKVAQDGIVKDKAELSDLYKGGPENSERIRFLEQRLRRAQRIIIEEQSKARFREKPPTAETLPGEMPEPGEGVGAVETKPGEGVTPETIVPPVEEKPPEPQPLSPAESRAVHGAPKPQTDEQIITAPHMDVRYPLGLLKASLHRLRNNLHREPTPEEIHKEADFIAGLHDVKLDDVNRREALGELLDKNPDESPSRGEITQKAGEYLDPKNKRTAQDVVNERIAERDKHPDQRFRNVLKKTSALARAKKPLTAAEQLQNDLELHREMLAVQAERKGNVLRKQTLAEKRETEAVKAKPPTELPPKKEGAGAAAKSKTAKAEQLVKEISDKNTGSEVVSNLFETDPDAPARLADELGHDINEKDLIAAGKLVQERTQAALADKPDTITVYRGGPIRGEIVPVTTKRDVAKRHGKGKVTEHVVPKQAILADMDVVNGPSNGWKEGELLIRRSDLEKPKFARTELKPLDRDRVKSSGIHSIGYDPKSKELEIKFLYGGGVYRYKGVPEKVHAELMASDSFGKYFNANIRKAYPAEKVAAFLKEKGQRGPYSLPESLPTTDNAVARLLSERISAWHPGEKAKFEAIPDNSLPEDLKPIVGAFTRTGARPVFVKNLTPHIEDFEGVAFGDRLLYINENADHPATALITHEFAHDLKQNSPELYKVLEDEIKSQLDKSGKLPEWAQNLKDRGYGENVTDEGAIEELVANGTGDAFSDPKFLEQVAQRNPTVFRKIADAFTKFINDLLARLGAIKDLGSNKYIQDVEAFRNKLLDVLEKYDPKHTEVLRAQGTAFGERISPAFARREPISTAEEAIAEAKKWEKRPVPLGERLLSVTNRGPDTLEPTAWQKLTRLMSNTIQPLQDYNEHMARQGTPVAPEADLYKSFTILRGRQAFEQNADHANYVAPIIDAIRVMAKEHGMSEGQFTGLFSQWVRAKDALNTNRRHELETIKLTPEATAKRAPLMTKVRDGTFTGNYLQELNAIVNAPGAKLEQHVEPVSGLTNVEAYKLLKAVKDAGFKDATGESLNKAFDPLRKRTTENQLRSGSFSEQDVRQQRAYENPYYMPKSDWADEDIRVPQKVFGSPLGAFDRMAYAGRETPADDPVQAAINKLLFSAKDVADNEATATLRNAILDPNQKLGATIRTYDMDKLANDALAGGKSLANMKKIAAGPRTVIHNRGRFRDVMTLPENSQQLRAIKESQAPVPLHGIHKAVAVPTGLYGRFHTALSPSFAMVNAVVRDGLYVPGMMVFQGRTDLLPGYIGNYMKFGGPMGAWKAYLTWDGALPRASNFADMEKYALANPDSFAGELYKLEKAGGSFNFRDEFNNAKKLEKLRDEMSRESLSPLNPIRWGHYIIQLQDAVATGSMMAGRVATFVAAKAKGMSDKEAAFYSRRLLDYQQTSEGSRILNSWFAFARVGITSVDAMFSALKDEKGYIDPKRAAVGMMVMGVATTGLYAALKSTLGDDKTKKLSDDALAKNVTIPNGTDSPIQLPIGLGMPRLAWGLSMMAVRLAEGDTTAASAGRTIKNLLMENVSPLHPIEAKEGADSGTNAADLAGALVPSILRPGYESFINQTAFGSQIHEAPQYTQGFASEAGRLTTGDMYKELARSLRVHTGLDVYPETIRHILSSYDPGAINLLLKNMEKEDMRAAGLEVDTSQATIFAALLNHDLKYAAGKQYYLSKLALEDAKKQEDLLKKANKPIPPSVEKQVELDKEFIKASKEHSKAVKAVTSNTLLSTETKTARLAAIQAAWSKTQESLSRQAQQLAH